MLAVASTNMEILIKINVLEPYMFVMWKGSKIVEFQTVSQGDAEGNCDCEKKKCFKFISKDLKKTNKCIQSIVIFTHSRSNA